VVPGDDQDMSSGADGTREPNLQNALDHPARREILRVLIDADEDKTSAELAELVPVLPVSNLNYHLLVLMREGCVSRTGEVAVAGGMLATYVATVADNQFVVDILDGTRGEDPGRDGG
jgi:hypothetical protein